MSIFQNYQLKNYYINDYDTQKAVDITSSARIKSYIKKYAGIAISPYIIQNGERPDQVSYAIYKTPYYDWVILLANDIYNIYDDWPKSTASLNEYITEKYGSISQAQSVLRYYNVHGDVISASSYNSLPANKRGEVENLYDYELKLNTNKSRIRIIKPNFVANIVSTLNREVYPAVKWYVS